MLCNAIGCVGFSWMASPACTELEMVVMNWLAEMLTLPERFKFGTPGTKGGGILQGSASEATLVAILSARAKAIDKFLRENPGKTEDDVVTKLIAYSSEQAHTCGERAARLAGVKYRALKVDEAYSVDADLMAAAIEEDKAQGLVPFFFMASFGTTSCCSFDDLELLGPLCKENDVWVHVDAAYAGAALACPEFRPLMPGVDLCDSFTVNLAKWMLVTFDCSAFWMSDATWMSQKYNVDPLFLKHKHENSGIPDYRHWEIPLGRRFRSLKVWFVLRMYGVEGIRAHIRKHVRLAREFAGLVEADERFELTVPVRLGLVCFRLKSGGNEANEALNSRVNERRNIHLTPARLGETFTLRVAICSRMAESADIVRAFEEICDVASELEEEKEVIFATEKPRLARKISNIFLEVEDSSKEFFQQFKENECCK